MNISPISAKFSTQMSKNIGFKSRYNDNYNEEDCRNFDYNDNYIGGEKDTPRDTYMYRQGVKMGAIYSLVVSLTAMAIAMGYGNDKSEKANDAFVRKVEKVYNSEDIQKDRLEIMDATEDEVPDLILYNKDGSRVIVDVKEKTFINE